MSALDNYTPCWEGGCKKIYCIIGNIQSVLYRRLYDKDWVGLNDKDDNKLFVEKK